jgi:hypothetical protein
MRATYDEIVSVGLERQHSIELVIGALLKAETAEADMAVWRIFS